MDGWVPKGGAVPPGDGAFERFLTAAIAAIITIMFSWRLLEDVSDSDQPTDEEGRKRRAAMYAALSAVPPSNLPSTSPRQLAELDIDEDDTGDVDGDNGPRDPCSVPQSDSGYQSLWGGEESGGVSNTSTSSNVDGTECNSEDLMKRFTSVPPLYLPTDAPQTTGESRTQQHHYHHHHHQLQHQPHQQLLLSDAVVHSSSATRRGHAADDMSDHHRMDFLDDGTTCIDWPPENADDFYNVSGDSDDAQPRELDSDEELYCCSLLEPIIEEDSDDFLSSSGESDSHQHPLTSTTTTTTTTTNPLLSSSGVRRFSDEFVLDSFRSAPQPEFGQLANEPSPQAVVEDVFSSESPLIPDRVDNSSNQSQDADDSESDESVQTVIRLGGGSSSSTNSSKSGSLETSPLHGPKSYNYPENAFSSPTRHYGRDVGGRFDAGGSSYPENMEDMLDKVLQANRPVFGPGESVKEGTDSAEFRENVEREGDSTDEDEHDSTIDNITTDNATQVCEAQVRTESATIEATARIDTKPLSQHQTQAPARTIDDPHSQHSSQLSDSVPASTAATQKLVSGERVDLARVNAPKISDVGNSARLTVNPEASSNSDSGLTVEADDMAHSGGVLDSYVPRVTRNPSAIDSLLTDFEDEPFSRRFGRRDRSPKREPERSVNVNTPHPQPDRHSRMETDLDSRPTRKAPVAELEDEPYARRRRSPDRGVRFSPDSSATELEGEPYGRRRRSPEQDRRRVPDPPVTEAEPYGRRRRSPERGVRFSPDSSLTELEGEPYGRRRRSPEQDRRRISEPPVTELEGELYARRRPHEQDRRPISEPPVTEFEGEPYGRRRMSPEQDRRRVPEPPVTELEEEPCSRRRRSPRQERRRVPEPPVTELEEEPYGRRRRSPEQERRLVPEPPVAELEEEPYGRRRRSPEQERRRVPEPPVTELEEEPYGRRRRSPEQERRRVPEPPVTELEEEPYNRRRSKPERRSDPEALVTELEDEPFARRTRPPKPERKSLPPEPSVTEFKEEPFSRRPGPSPKQERNSKCDSFVTDLDQELMSREPPVERLESEPFAPRRPGSSKPERNVHPESYVTDLDAEPFSRRSRDSGRMDTSRDRQFDENFNDSVDRVETKPKRDPLLMELDEEPFGRRRRGGERKPVSMETDLDEKPAYRSDPRIDRYDPDRSDRKTDSDLTELGGEPSSKRRRRRRRSGRNSTPMETDLDDEPTRKSDVVTDLDRGEPVESNLDSFMVRLEEAPMVRKVPASDRSSIKSDELDRSRRSDTDSYRGRNRDDSDFDRDVYIEERRDSDPDRESRRRRKDSDPDRDSLRRERGDSDPFKKRRMDSPDRDSFRRGKEDSDPGMTSFRSENDPDRSLGKKSDSNSVDSFLTELDEEPFSRRVGRRRRSPDRVKDTREVPPPSTDLHTPSKVESFPDTIKSKPESCVILESPVISAPVFPTHTDPSIRTTPDPVQIPDTRSEPDTQISTAVVPESPSMSMPTAVLLTQTNTRIFSSPQMPEPGSSVTVEDSPTLSLPAVLDQGPGAKMSLAKRSILGKDDPFADASTSNAVEQTPKGYTFMRCESESTHSERRIYLVDTPEYADFDSFINNVPYTSESVGYLEDGTAVGFDEYSAFVQDLHRPPITSDDDLSQPVAPKDINEGCILSGNLVSPPPVDVFEFPEAHSRLPAVSSVSQNIFQKECESEELYSDTEAASQKDKSSKADAIEDVLDTSFDIDNTQAREKMETDFAFLRSGNTVRLPPEDRKETKEDEFGEMVEKVEDRLDEAREENEDRPDDRVEDSRPRFEDKCDERKDAVEDRLSEKGPDKQDSLYEKPEDRFPKLVTWEEDRQGETVRKPENRIGERVSVMTESPVESVSVMKDRSSERVPFVGDRPEERMIKIEDSPIEKAPGDRSGEMATTESDSRADTSEEKESEKVETENIQPTYRDTDKQTYSELDDLQFADDDSSDSRERIDKVEETPNKRFNLLSETAPRLDARKEEFRDDGSGRTDKQQPIRNWSSEQARDEMSKPEKFDSHTPVHSESSVKLEEASPILFFQPAAMLHADQKAAEPKDIEKPPVIETRDVELKMPTRSEKRSDSVLDAKDRLESKRREFFMDDSFNTREKMFDTGEKLSERSQDTKPVEEVRSLRKNEPSDVGNREIVIQSGPETKFVPESSERLQLFPGPPLSLFRESPRPKPRLSSKPTPLPRSKSVGDELEISSTHETAIDDDGVFHGEASDSDTDSHPSLEDGDEEELMFKPRIVAPVMSEEKRPRSLKEIRRQQKSGARPMIAPFTLPDNMVLPSRLKIMASRRQFLSSENLDASPNTSLQEQFAAHKLSQQQAKERRYKSPNKQLRPSSYSSQDQLEKLHYLLNYSRQSESSFDRAPVDHLHEGCILTPEGRRSILDKTQSIENLQVDLSRHLRRYGSVTSLVETDIDTGETLETNFFPETNLDIFDHLFQSHQPLQRSASMSDLVLNQQEESPGGVPDHRGRGLGMSLPSQTHKSTGKGRFAYRKYQKSKSLCTLETNLDDVGEEGEEPMRRVPSVHELRVTKSLQKLNVPDWFKQSSLTKSSSCLLKYGSNSTMNSFSFSPSLISSPCASTAPPAPNVVIKTRVVPPSNPRALRSPNMFATSGPAKPPPTQVKLPSEKLREKEKNKNLMPIPIVPFAQIRAMFEKKAKVEKEKESKGPAPADMDKVKDVSKEANKPRNETTATVPAISINSEEEFSREESKTVSTKRTLFSDKPPLPPTRAPPPAPVPEDRVTPTVTIPASSVPRAGYNATNGVSDDVDGNSVSVSLPTAEVSSPPSRSATVPEKRPSSPPSDSEQKSGRELKDNSLKNASKDSQKDAQTKTLPKDAAKQQFSPTRSLRQFFGRSKDKSSEKKSDGGSSLDSSFSSGDGVYEKEPRRLGASTDRSRRPDSKPTSTSFDRSSSREARPELDSSFSSVEGQPLDVSSRSSRPPSQSSTSFPASTGPRPSQYNADRHHEQRQPPPQPPYARLGRQDDPREPASMPIRPEMRDPPSRDPPKFQRRLPGQGTSFGRLPSSENGDHVHHQAPPTSTVAADSSTTAGEKKSVKETTV